MGVRLPSAYQEVEYLERTDTTSNGPYIITNIYGDNTLDFSIKAMCYQTGGDRTFFGSRNSFSGASAQIYNVVNASGGKFGFGNHAWNYWPSINISGGEVFTVQKIGSTVESSGGANFSVAGDPEFTTPYTLEIFAMSTGTQNRHNQEGLNGRIYNLTFSRNGKAIADFVPCYRKQDHKPGMFDLCGSVCDITDSPFYVSANTGEFLVGPDVIDSISPLMIAWRRMLMRQKPARLPAEYQEVEYLESNYLNGVRTYIDTGILITDDLIFELDFQATQQTTTRYFMGRYHNYEFYLYRSTNNYFQVEYNSSWRDLTVVADNNRHKFSFQIINNRVIVTENEEVVLETQKTGSPSNPIMIAGTTEGAAAPCKTFESKMTKAGAVIQDLIPCYRKSDSKPGMYDLVTNQFFTNAGTGEFEVGHDVN